MIQPIPPLPASPRTARDKDGRRPGGKPRKRAPAKRASNGVMATIERVTGLSPCPLYLRTILNQYLRVPGLFPASVKGPQGCNLTPDCDALVANLFELHAAFGKTKFVAALVLGKKPAADIAVELDKARQRTAERAELYARSVRAIDTLRHTMAGTAVDLRQRRLVPPGLAAANPPAPSSRDALELLAVRELEQQEDARAHQAMSPERHVQCGDAHLALGHLAQAHEHAVKALDLDAGHAQAWFLRVSVLLKLRNGAMRDMQHHQMLSTEFADPGSAHEACEREEAAHFAGIAQGHQAELARVLPLALLHWPRSDGRRWDHEPKRAIVRNLFISHAFAAVLSGGSLDGCSRTRWQANGFEPEWRLLYESLQLRGWGRQPQPLLGEQHMQALALVVAEQDESPTWNVFDPPGSSSLARDLKLLHLRRALALPGYEAHWSAWRSRAQDLSALCFEDEILSDPQLSQVWQSHEISNNGPHGPGALLAHWRHAARERTLADHDQRLLEQLALLFHHHFCRRQFDAGRAVAHQAQDVAGRSRVTWCRHPFVENVGMPIYSSLYWRWLAALCTVEMLVQAPGQHDASSIELLRHAGELRAAFAAAPDECQWLASQEYEEGGGEDWLEPPYGDIDLSEPDRWLAAIRAVLSDPALQPQHRCALDAQASTLAQFAQPAALASGTASTTA